MWGRQQRTIAGAAQASAGAATFPPLLALAVGEVTPLELLAHAREEALGAEPHEQDGLRGPLDDEALARVHRRAHLAVERDQHVLRPRWDRLHGHGRLRR